MNSDLSLGVSVLDSATWAGAAQKDKVLVSGSHGGRYAAYCAARACVRAAVFNDAGGGLDAAGTAGLLYLAQEGIAAVTISHMSARIGIAMDTRNDGVISAVNQGAALLGCSFGDKLTDALPLLARAAVYRGIPAPIREGRTHLTLKAATDAIPIWLLDSGSLVREDDKGAILIIGSHGGIPGANPANALKARAFLAIFNDAGVGRDNAGIGRLAALETHGVAAATVAATSARIGDAQSSFDTGIISFCNAQAAGLGLLAGQACRDAVATALKHERTHQVSGARQK